MSIKKFLYWSTLVMPIIDIITGVCEALAEIPENVRKIHETRLDLENTARFEYEMNFQDMEEEEFDDKFNEACGLKKKGKKKNG